MPRAVNFRRGIGTGRPAILGKFPVPDPTLAHLLYSEFHTYTASDWVLAGTGTPTRALVDNEDGGILRLGNSAASGDANGIRWAGGAGAARNTFSYTVGKKLGFKARVKVNTATSVTLNFGLGDTTYVNAITAGNAIALQATASGWTLVVYDGGVARPVVSFGGIPALDTNYHVYSIVCERSGVKAYQDNRLFATCTATLPTALLAPFFSVRNGTTSARQLDIDYFVAMKER